MKTKIDKQEVLDALRRRLADVLDGLVEAQKTVQDGAVHPEARQEHPKDTRATEASYLARGLAERVEKSRDGVTAASAMRLRRFGADDPLAVGALIGLLDEEDHESVVFLAPAGGGEKLEVGGATVLVLTPASPLGAALAGRLVGDEIEVELPVGKRIASIDWAA